jgi:hypothetical protein
MFIMQIETLHVRRTELRGLRRACHAGALDHGE